MEIYIINLLYFLIVIPIVIPSYFIILKLKEKKENNDLAIILVLIFMTFGVRLVLVFFAETIGTMPYLIEDVLFYTLLTIFGLALTFIYVFKIEEGGMKKIGWDIEDPKKSIAFGLLGFLPLILFFPIIMVLGDIQLAIAITWEKTVVAAGFAILGAFYEEIMFRGIIQNHINKLTDEKKSILYTAIIFTLTHLFYLPFIGFGIFYIFVFIMAVILSVLRYKYDQLACAILHGGIVFILIIFV